MTLEAQPFKEAGLGCCTWDKRRNQLPTLILVVNVAHIGGIFFAMFADQPY